MGVPVVVGTGGYYVRLNGKMLRLKTSKGAIEALVKGGAAFDDASRWVKAAEGALKGGKTRARRRSKRRGQILGSMPVVGAGAAGSAVACSEYLASFGLDPSWALFFAGIFGAIIAPVVARLLDKGGEKLADRLKAGKDGGK